MEIDKAEHCSYFVISRKIQQLLFINTNINININSDIISRLVIMFLWNAT